MSTLRTYVGDKLVAIGDILEKPYQRPSNYPSITEPTASEEKVVILARIFKPFGTGNSARNELNVYFVSSSSAQFTVTGSDGTSETFNSGVYKTVVFDYDNATSYAVDVNSATTATDYYIEDLGNTSQADWNTLAGTSGVTYEVGSYITTAVAGSTLSDSTGTVSIYNFRHVVITATGTNWTQARRAARPVTENMSYEEIYVSLPNNTETLTSNLTFIRPLRVNDNIKYYKFLTTLSSITNASSFFNSFKSLVELDAPSGFLPNCTNFSNFFTNCHALTKAPFIDMSNATTGRAAFQNCHEFPGVMKYDLSSATDVRNLYVACRKLRIAGDVSFPNATLASPLFSGCSNLVEIGDVNIPNSTTAFRLLSGCTALEKVGTVTASSATDWEQCFFNCTVLKTIDNVVFPSTGTVDLIRIYYGCHALKTAFVPDSAVSISDLYQAFLATYALEEIKPLSVTINASTITSNNKLRQIFRSSGIYRLPNITFSTSTFSGANNQSFADIGRAKEIPAYDLSALTVPLNNNSLFFQTNISGGGELQRIRATGIACTFTIRDNHMSADALDELMTNCATVTGKTMDLRNNPGTADCDTTIATNKGWTVTT
tara:strand:- start:249 stop:2054 length:1806 start_codon:yes stop_codon:yes gene_type:complete